VQSELIDLFRSGIAKSRLKAAENYMEHAYIGVGVQQQQLKRNTGG